MADLSMNQEQPLMIQMWITRGCYFNMAERLRRKSRFSVGSNAALSFYVICISIYLLIPKLQTSAIKTEWLSIVTLILSVFILVTTLLESSKSYALTAERAQQKALQISEIYVQYRSALADNAVKVNEAEYAKKYSEMLGSSEITRRPIDYHLFQFNNRRATEFKFSVWDKVQVLCLVLINWVTEYWLYGIMMWGPLAAGLWFTIRFGL